MNDREAYRRMLLAGGAAMVAVFSDNPFMWPAAMFVVIGTIFELGMVCSRGDYVEEAAQ